MACDVPIHAYGYSFELNANWSTAFAPGAEIHAYQKRVAAKHGIYAHCQFNTEVRRLEYLAEEHVWAVTVLKKKENRTETFFTKIIVDAKGIQHHAMWPKLPGVNDGTFKGTLEVHSVDWRPEHDDMVRGKNVVVIGSAASAIQIVPALADKVKTLTVLQRTPNWIVPKTAPYLPRQLDYGPWWKWVFANVPGAMRLHYYSIFYGLDAAYATSFLRPGSTAQSIGQQVMTASMTRRLRGRQDLVEKLVPKYEIGCKRPVLSDTFLQTFLKPNVKLLASALTRVEPDGVLCANGDKVVADVVIYCTGYRFADPGLHFEVVTPEFTYNDDVRKHAEETYWTGAFIPGAIFDQIRTYKGVAHPKMPNYFTTFGTNCGVANSALVTLEANTAYIARVIKLMESKHVAELRVKQELCDKFNAEVDKALEGTVFTSSKCTSYYKADGTGKVVIVSPFSASKFIASMAPPSNLDEYNVVMQAGSAAPLSMSARL